MLKRNPVLILVTALALGGCALSPDGGQGGGTLARAYSSTKTAIGLSGDPAAAAVTSAASGGLIGARLVPLLTEEDRKLAYDAEIIALDRGASGAPVPWKNPVSGHYGNIVPGPAYNQKGAQCRGFSHTITVNGALTSARGTACRSLEGAWAAVG